jgi:hypothetical protein
VTSEALFKRQLIELVTDASILLCILCIVKIEDLVQRMFYLRTGINKLYHDTIQAIGTKKKERTKERAQGLKEKK